MGQNKRMLWHREGKEISLDMNLFLHFMSKCLNALFLWWGTDNVCVWVRPRICATSTKSFMVSVGQYAHILLTYGFSDAQITSKSNGCLFSLFSGYHLISPPSRAVLRMGDSRLFISSLSYTTDFQTETERVMGVGRVQGETQEK